MRLPDTNDYRFSDWIQSTADLQTEAYGSDPIQLLRVRVAADDDYEGHFYVEEEGADFFRWNAFALVSEVVEMSEEIGWKPWATNRDVDRTKLIGEAVDAMHFLANILRMVGCTGNELTNAYKSKQMRNLERQQKGYTGKDKCGRCHRELDQVDDRYTHEVKGKKFCDARCASEYVRGEEPMF